MKVEYRTQHEVEVESLDELPDNAIVLAIDDTDVIARCEACSDFILDGDAYACDEDGVYLCKDCMSESPAD